MAQPRHVKPSANIFSYINSLPPPPPSPSHFPYVDISTLGLTDLRSRVTIIPQDPTILSGTLRSTLDVFGEYSDHEIYESLRRVHLIPAEGSTGPAMTTDAEGQEVSFFDTSRALSCPSRGMTFVLLLLSFTIAVLLILVFLLGIVMAFIR